MVLAVTQPLRIGDLVTFEGETGTVEDVSLTYTWLRTGSDARLIIPNERLAAGVLRNDSIRSPTVALEVSAWLAPDADETAALAAVAALDGDAAPRASPRSPTRASACRSPGRPWRPAERIAREGELRAEVLRALREAGCRGPSRRTLIYPSRVPDVPTRAPTPPASQQGRRQPRHLRVPRPGRDRRDHRRHRRGGAGSSTWPTARRRWTRSKPIELGATSRVYAADGKTRLGFINANVLRTPVHSDEIPDVVREATVAIEDRRFYEHQGVDFEGIVRAAVKNVESKKDIQGGSTLTMQLVRNLYTGERARTGVAGYKRKIREAKLAQELEDRHPGRPGKLWIVNKYVNSVPYGTVGGQTAVGIQAAARIFFDKPAARLTLREAALLAGLPQAPSNYNPFLDTGAATARRNDVLQRMADQGYITQATANKTMAMGLGVKHNRYYTAKREGYVFDYVKQYLIDKYGVDTVPPRRPARRHDDRPAPAEARAQGAGRQPRRARPRRRDRHHRPAAPATCGRWPRRRATATRSSTSPPRATARPARPSRSWS